MGRIFIIDETANTYDVFDCSHEIPHHRILDNAGHILYTGNDFSVLRKIANEAVENVPYIRLENIDIPWEDEIPLAIRQQWEHEKPTSQDSKFAWYFNGYFSRVRDYDYDEDEINMTDCVEFVRQTTEFKNLLAAMTEVERTEDLEKLAYEPDEMSFKSCGIGRDENDYPTGETKTMFEIAINKDANMVRITYPDSIRYYAYSDRAENEQRILSMIRNAYLLFPYNIVTL